MAAACSGELSTLVPLIDSCPADTEYVLFTNVAGQQGGYAFRTWARLKACILAALTFVPVQFKIGDVGSLMIAGEDTIQINQNNVIQDSVQVFLDGSLLPRSDSSQVSYEITFNAGNFVIQFNQDVSNDQQYNINYAYAN